MDKKISTHFMRGYRGEGAGGPDPPEKSQNIGFLSNIRSPENHKATKSAFNVGP